MSDPPFAFCDKACRDSWPPKCQLTEKGSSNSGFRKWTTCHLTARSWHVKCHVSRSAGSPSRRRSWKLLPALQNQCCGRNASTKRKAFLCSASVPKPTRHVAKSESFHEKTSATVSRFRSTRNIKSCFSAPSRWRCLEGVARPTAQTQRWSWTRPQSKLLCAVPAEG